MVFADAGTDSEPWLLKIVEVAVPAAAVAGIQTTVYAVDVTECVGRVGRLLRRLRLALFSPWWLPRLLDPGMVWWTWWLALGLLP